MPLIHLSSGASFGAEDGASLLDAAARAGVNLAYSCRTGRCSTCRCRVSSGTSVALHEELGLSAQERAEGWILGCVRSATSDMQIEVDDLGGAVLPPVRTVPCRVHALDRPAGDVVRVVLRLPPTGGFSFLPGQYVDVIGHGGIRRSYSLANADAGAGLLELHVRAVADGAMSAYWFARARVNDLLRLNGPLGTFFLRRVAGLDLVFLATGTGIAPVKAMLEGLPSMVPAQRPRSIAVYWGGRTPADLYCDVAALPGLDRYVPVLSRADAAWPGARGHVQQALLADRPDLAHTLVYACGSDAMIHSARALLQDAGLPERRFLSDAFVCSAAA